LTCVACLIPRITAKHFLHQYYPYDNDIIREIELVIHKDRNRRNNQDQDDDLFDVDEELASRTTPTSSYQYSKDKEARPQETTQP